MTSKLYNSWRTYFGLYLNADLQGFSLRVYTPLFCLGISIWEQDFLCSQKFTGIKLSTVSQRWNLKLREGELYYKYERSLGLRLNDGTTIRDVIRSVYNHVKTMFIRRISHSYGLD